MEVPYVFLRIKMRLIIVTKASLRLANPRLQLPARGVAQPPSFTEQTGLTAGQRSVLNTQSHNGELTPNFSLFSV